MILVNHMKIVNLTLPENILKQKHYVGSAVVCLQIQTIFIYNHSTTVDKKGYPPPPMRTSFKIQGHMFLRNTVCCCILFLKSLKNLTLVRKRNSLKNSSNTTT